MCGRYTIFQTNELAKRYKLPAAELKSLTEELKETYNAAPDQTLPVVVQQEHQLHLVAMEWGFLPVWATERQFKRLINARAETVFEKPIWKGAVRHHRCLVPANGFYEWKATPTGKQPFYIRPEDQELFSFAGVFSTLHDASGSEWDTFAIITTDANKQMREVHNRMPIILRPEDEARWLDTASDSPDDLLDLLTPYAGKLDMHEVSRDVNVVRNNDQRLIVPINSQ